VRRDIAETILRDGTFENMGDLYPLQRRRRRFEPVTAHLVNPLVSVGFSPTSGEIRLASRVSAVAQV
jgi:hypothetical protein